MQSLSSSSCLSTLSPLATTTIILSPPQYCPWPIKSSLQKKNQKGKKQEQQSSWVSPDWLTALTRSLSKDDESGIPVAAAKLEDVSELLGGALFLPLYKWMNEYGPVYRLAAGPRDFVVISDPAMAKHVLRNYAKYGKGLVAEVSEFLFGSGFAIAEGPLWTVNSFGQ